MNLGAILSDLYRRFRYTENPPSQVRLRLTAFVNECHHEIVGLPGMERLRDDVMPVTAFANVARTGLPPTVGRVRAIVDRANNQRLAQVPLSELRSADPAQAFISGFPLRYAVIGYQEVQLQPATTGLWVVSSSSADTTQKAYTEAVLTGGYPEQSVSGGTALNGTTRVQIGTRTDHIEVVKFYLDSAAAGYVSLYDAAASGTELARIPIGQTYSRYLTVEWFPIQTANCIEYVDYTRTIMEMMNPADEPLLPPDFHYVIAVGARVKEYETLSDDRLNGAKLEYQRGITALRSWVLNNGDRIASLRRTPVQWSSLGSQFPAGS